LIAALLIVLALPVIGQNQDEYKFSLVPRRVNVLSALPVNAAGYLLNDGSGGLSWGAIDTTSLVARDGTRELTADWNVGAFDLTCVDMNATNFKLSGTGTLASTLGNVSLTTSLTAASGNEVGFYLPVTVNKAAGNYTAFKVNATETSAPGTSDYLMDLQVGDVSKATIFGNGFLTLAAGLTCSSGIITANQVNAGSIATYSTTINNTAGDAGFTLNSQNTSTAGRTGVTIGSGTWSMTSGANNIAAITPTYNQTSGTASNTDLLINRTETAVGSGTQRLASMRVGSTERVGFDNKGFEVRSYPLSCTHNTATALFGITIAAGSTAGGVITYTLNVTDDDGSDDQIEVGTVQFCGLQDEANWHTNISEVSTQALESGSLATTWAIDTATANTLKVTLLANSDLTTPVYTLSYTVTFNNAYTVTTY
jgi:hypothetical protein